MRVSLLMVRNHWLYVAAYTGGRGAGTGPSCVCGRGHGTWNVRLMTDDSIVCAAQSLSLLPSLLFLCFQPIMGRALNSLKAEAHAVGRSRVLGRGIGKGVRGGR